MIPQQRCPDCTELLSLEAFTPSKRGKSGEKCRECQHAYDRKYYRANKERLDPINRAYALAHKEEMRAYKQKYAETHPYGDHRRAYFRNRYQEKHEEIRTYQRQRQKQTPEIGARRTMRYYARKCGAEGTHTAADWKALRVWFGNQCLCCGATKKLEADHVVPLDSGGSDDISNIQPLCRSCNAIKHTQTIDYRDPVRLAEFLATLEN